MFKFLNGIFKSNENKGQFKYFIRVGNADFGFNSANDVSLAYSFFQNNCDLDIKVFTKKGRVKEIETTPLRIHMAEKNKVNEILLDIPVNTVNTEKQKEESSEEMEFADD